MEFQFQNSLDLTAVLGEYVVHNLIDKAYSSLKTLIKSYNSDISFTKVDFERNLKYEFTKTVNWAKEVKLQEFNYSQSIKSIYVELDLYFSLRRNYKNENDIKKYKFSQLLNEYSEHLIVLGQPGAGKTTSLKHLCYSLLFDENNQYNSNHVPLLIRLRDINTDLVGLDDEYHLCIFRYLFTKLGINVNYQEVYQKDQRRNIIIRSVISVLEDLNILLVLDGLDEVTDFSKKAIIAQELQELTLGLNNARLILTSRLGEFNAIVNNALIFEVCSLSEVQIKEFANKRFTDKEQSNDFINQIINSTYFDAALRPLTLAYLTLIFERFGRIHDKPKEIYKRILRLLIEDWNVQNSVNRKSKYSNFDTDRKLEFLASLAYHLTINFKTTTFTEENLEETYKTICRDFDLPFNQVKNIVSEIENHNGLFIQTFYNKFEFSHKSLQEYLTADYIIRQPLTGEYELYLKTPNELAISVALSANPTKYLCVFLNFITNKGSSADFYKTFCTRLFIEKPDYKANGNLIFAFLYMYRGMKMITDKNAKERFNEMTYRSDDRLGDVLIGFEDFFASELGEVAFNDFLNYYTFTEITDKIDYHKQNTEGGYETIYIKFLKRKKYFEDINKEIQPQYLVMNSRMYDIIKK